MVFGLWWRTTMLKGAGSKLDGPLKDFFFLINAKYLNFF